MARVRGQDADGRPAERAEDESVVRGSRQSAQSQNRQTADDGSAGGSSGGKPSADGLEFTLDADWRITSITSAAAAWCGSTVENLLGRNGREVNPAATTLLGDAIEGALRRGKTTRREQPSTHVPGRWVRWQYHVADVIPDELGA